MGKRDFSRSFVISAVILLVAIGLWAILQSFCLNSGSIEEQLNFVRQNSALFKMNYLVGSFLTFPFIFLLFLIFSQKRVEGKSGLLDLLGLTCLVPYFIFIHLSYGSQYLLIPRLISNMTADNTEFFKWYYIGNQFSIPVLLKMLGYMFFSIGAVIIAFPFSRIKAYSRWVSSTLFLSGVTGLFGWLEYYLELPGPGFGLAVSGLLMIPFCLSILITSRKIKIGLKPDDLCFG